ncbi:hypothetical protein KCU99_g135, partial [Aureobasidium melanogenum]
MLDSQSTSRLFSSPSSLSLSPSSDESSSVSPSSSVSSSSSSVPTSSSSDSSVSSSDDSSSSSSSQSSNVFSLAGAPDFDFILPAGTVDPLGLSRYRVRLGASRRRDASSHNLLSNEIMFIRIATNKDT